MLDPFAVANLLVNILMHCNIYHHSVVVTLPQPSNFKGQCRILAKEYGERKFHNSLQQGLEWSPIIIIISGLHHKCVAPLVANNLQSGRFWARSMTARGSRGRSAPSSSRSFAVIPVASSNTQNVRKSRSAQRLHCRPFGRYAQIG